MTAATVISSSGRVVACLTVQGAEEEARRRSRRGELHVVVDQHGRTVGAYRDGQPTAPPARPPRPAAAPALPGSAIPTPRTPPRPQKVGHRDRIPSGNSAEKVDPRYEVKVDGVVTARCGSHREASRAFARAERETAGRAVVELVSLIAGVVISRSCRYADDYDVSRSPVRVECGWHVHCGKATYLTSSRLEAERKARDLSTRNPAHRIAIFGGPTGWGGAVLGEVHREIDPPTRNVPADRP